MVSKPKLVVPHVKDRALVAAFVKVAESFPCGGLTVKTLSTDNLSAPIKLDKPDENPDWSALSELDSDLIWFAEVTVGASMLLRFYRGAHDANGENVSPYWDHITIDLTGGGQLTAGDRARILSILVDRLCAVSTGQDGPRAISASGGEALLQVHDGVLTRLQNVTTQLIEDTAQHQRRLEAEHLKKSEELQKKLSEKSAEVDERLETGKKDLIAREQALTDHLKMVDDRENKHARRAIRDKMLSDVQARIANFGVSVTTERKRVPVRLALGLLVALLIWSAVIATAGLIRLDDAAVAAISHAKAGSIDQSVQWSLWIRLAVSSIALTATILYYVRWESSWAQLHADNEFQLQQFYIDVNRANWVIESSLEWKKETQDLIPHDLLAELSRNLFVDRSAQPDRVVHPADELASALIGSASKIKLNAAGNEIEFGKPSRIPNKA